MNGVRGTGASCKSSVCYRARSEMDVPFLSYDSDDATLTSEADKEFVSMLIDMYADCPELWDRKHVSYTKHNIRNMTLLKIAENLKEFKKGLTIANLKRKINTLRTSFNREHAKVKRSIQCGMSGDQVYQPKLWYYHKMLFILDSTEIAPAESSTHTNDSQTNFPDESPPLPEPSVRQPLRKKIKSSPSTEELEIPSSQVLETTETESVIVARGWAMKLNRLPRDQRLYAEKIINDTLFEAEMGTLSRRGVRFMSSPDYH